MHTNAANMALRPSFHPSTPPFRLSFFPHFLVTSVHSILILRFFFHSVVPSVVPFFHTSFLLSSFFPSSTLPFFLFSFIPSLSYSSFHHSFIPRCILFLLSSLHASFISFFPHSFHSPILLVGRGGALVE